MRIVIVLVVIVVGITLFLYHPKFGRKPSGNRLAKFQNLPNYKDGQFQNEHLTPDLAEGATYYKVLTKFFFGKSKTNAPKNALPSKKTDLKNLDPNENVVVWFGHSSYFIQADGKTMLVDPVFSGSASPVSFTTKAFKGTDVYTADDFPEIDYLFISHDHWDHLDHDTVLKLKSKVKKVITGLGAGEHFERWGYDSAIINERNWHEELILNNGFSVTITPGRHFSGRGLKRNTALWVSFVLKTPSFKLFLGGDSGYDTHFKAIGKEHGPFDLALLECGQYNEYWKYIHMMPEEVVTAAQDLHAKNLMPVHWAKFSLSVHDWDEPVKRVTAAAQKENMHMVTPMIGEKVNLNNLDSVFPKWWEGVE
jgi:L-ascorbate metabolism protein UlaG (beta-lactamase superfamily)